jgi:hypothetical protein
LETRQLSRNTGTYVEACDLDDVPKPSNKHNHLHKEYKYRNGAFKWVSKPDVSATSTTGIWADNPSISDGVSPRNPGLHPGMGWREGRRPIFPRWLPAKNAPAT